MSQLFEQVLQINIYVQPIHFLLAITTNILNIRVLCSHTLRFSRCTHYLMAYSMFSIIYTCLVCSVQFLRGFHIDWANGKIGCKMNFYFLFVTPAQANIMLILASFDRYHLSLQPCQLRSASIIRTTRMIIMGGTLLTGIYMLPMLIIYRWDETSRKCIQQINLFAHIYVSSQIILFYILSPLSMIVFGLLTIFHIHQQSMRAAPLVTSIRNRRTEGQLTRMLLLQVGIHILLAVPYGVTYGMNTFIPRTQTPDILAVRYAFLMWQQCDYFISFFLYVLSGRAYREQLIRILRSMQCCYRPPMQSFV